jgi:hypothetical protein
MRPLLLLALAACAVPAPDLNTECVLIRGNPDGGAPLPILRSDPVIAFQAQADILSFGATECSTKICVRDFTYMEAPGDNRPEAHGYCSEACGPCASKDPNLDKNMATKLFCRALLLDDMTLMALKQSDPARYMQLFGNSPQANFCARGGPNP